MDVGQRDTLKLRLSRDAVRVHGASDYPKEACGILLGRIGDAGMEVLEAVPCRNANVERSGDQYLVEPLDQLRIGKEGRQRGLDILGYYHSHPDHPSRASATDLAQSWEGLLYLILAVKQGHAGAMQGWWRPFGNPAFTETTVELI